MNCPNWTYGWRNYAHPPRLSPTHSPWTLRNTTCFSKCGYVCVTLYVSEWYISCIYFGITQNIDMQPHHIHSFQLSSHNLYGYMICYREHLLCLAAYGWIYELSNLMKKHLNDSVFAAGHFCSCRWVLLYSHSVLACPTSSTKTCCTYIACTHRQVHTYTHKNVHRWTAGPSSPNFALLLIKNNERTCAEQS